jgi:hypothetical protein
MPKNLWAGVHSQTPEHTTFFFPKWRLKNRCSFSATGRALHAGPAAAVTVEDDGGGTKSGVGATSMR